MKKQQSGLFEVGQMRKGDFIDFMNVDRVQQWEISEISGTKMLIHSLKEDSRKLTVDLNSSSIRPFRTCTKPTSIISQYHKYYCYWADGLPQALSTLKRINQSPDLIGEMSIMDIIQFWKGKNFYLVMSFNQRGYVTQQNSNLIYQYVQQFLLFFSRYWQTLRGTQMSGKRLYDSLSDAMLMSSPEIIINLGVLLCRVSNLDLPDSNNNATESADPLKMGDKTMDRALVLSLEWAKQKFIPSLLDTNFDNFEFEFILQLFKVVLNLINMGRVQRSGEFPSLFIRLARSLNHTSKCSSLAKFNDNYNSVNSLFVMATCKNSEFYEILKCKLRMLIDLEDLVNQYVTQISQKNATLSKHKPFLIRCFQYADDDTEIRELLMKFLTHENGLLLYFINSSVFTNERELTRFLKFYPGLYFETAIKLRKVEILKLQNVWTIRLLIMLINKLFQVNATMQKEDLSFNVNMHRFIISQYNLQTANLGPNSNLEYSTIVVNLKKMIEELQNKIIKLCQLYCDALEKTITIEHVEKCMLGSYIQRQSQSIAASMDSKETNNFRQNFIYRLYIGRTLASNVNGNNKELILCTFRKLCQNMIYLKSKLQLEARKENLIILLSKCILNWPKELVSSVCLFIQCVTKVQNKQFRSRVLQFLVAFMAKNSAIFSTPDQKLQAYKKFITVMKIESLVQLRLFMDLFKIVNYQENAIRMQDESMIPLIIFKRPFGLEKFLQAFLCMSDRIMATKLMQFFGSIQFVIADQSVKCEMLEEITDKLLEFLVIAVMQESSKASGQYIADLVEILYSLISYDITQMSCIQSLYLRMFQLNTKHQSTNSKETNNRLSFIPAPDQNSGTTCRHQKFQVRVKVGENSKKIESNSQPGRNADELILEFDHGQMVYNLKARATSYFQMFPILSDLFIDGKKLTHLDQAMSLGCLYNKYHKQMEHEDEVSQAASQKVTPEAQQCRMGGQQMERPNNNVHKQRGEIPVVNLVLRSHENREVVKEIMMNKLKYLYDCLPYTNKIWMGLKISTGDWESLPQLIEIKQKFISSLPETRIRKQCKKMSKDESAIIEIIGQPLKKKYLFEALVQESRLTKTSWIMDTFNEINTKVDIENNILSITLMEKYQVRLTQQDATQEILVKLRTVDSRQTALSPDEQKLFDILLNKVFAYIQAHAEFDLLHFILTLIPLAKIIQVRELSFKICSLLRSVFHRYIVVHYEEFFESKLFYYINEHPHSFELLIHALNSLEVTENQTLLPALEHGLAKAIRLLIMNSTNSAQREQTNEQLLHLIYCLLSKNVRTPELYSAEFKSIIYSLLLSKKLNISLHILTYLINQSAAETQYCMSYFRNEIKDGEWNRKEYIKFNRSNFRPDSDCVGLINPHSICYANSLLQQLYYIEPFRRELYLAKWKKNDHVEEDLIYQLKRIFLNLNFKQCESYINRYFFEAFKNDEGSPTSLEVQMDVDEFRNILLDRIQNLIIKPENEPRNLVQKLFNGKQLTIIKSKDCPHESSRQEEFSSICLEVMGLINLHGALEHYFKPEILKEDNKYFCEECNQKVVAEKRNVIKQYPRYLTFVLKRFEYMFQIRRKVNERFEFPLGTFQMSQDVTYSLKGVIIHQGLSEAGHYFSLIKRKNRWYQFNDNHVVEIFEPNVIAYSFGQSSGKSNKNAYLLIYEKVDEQMNPTSEVTLSQISEWETGLEADIAEIKRQNSHAWKSNLFLSQEFELFLQNTVKNRIPGSVSLLFQYITTIRAKFSKTDIKATKHLFRLLQTYSNECLLNESIHVEWAIKFYRSPHFNPSIKSAMTDIILKNYNGLHENMQQFIGFCVAALHDEIETSPFYYLFLRICKTDPQALKLLMEHRLIGRIYDVSFSDILLTVVRQDLSKSAKFGFPRSLSGELMKKNLMQSSELRYHKWQLVNYIIRSAVQLHPIEKSYIWTWAQIKTRHIFEEATCKANINKISEFFVYLSTNNELFSGYYLSQICLQISKKDRIENLRKYLKAAFDLLNLNDLYKLERFKKIKQSFAQSFRTLHVHKIIAGFDVKWQWFIKIVYFNSEFRDYVRQNVEEFRILLNKSELSTYYLSRNEVSLEGKYKNKYYGLKFSSISAMNIHFLESKIDRTKQMFDPQTPESFFKQIYDKEYNCDKCIADYPDLRITPSTVVLKYFENSYKFKQVEVTDVFGDLIEVNENYCDKGDERYMCIPAQQNQEHMEEEVLNMVNTKMEEQEQAKVSPKRNREVKDFNG